MGIDSTILKPVVAAAFAAVAALLAGPAAPQGVGEGPPVSPAVPLAPVPAAPATPGAGAADPSATARAELDALFARLADPANADWQRAERRIEELWSQSGSAALDLLLRRGREALEANDLDAAIEHLSALIDHAPDFAEGYNARALAFYRKGRPGLALADLAHVLRLEPRHFGALVGVAVILEELERKPEALRAWRAVEAIHPHHPELRQAIERLQRATLGNET